MTNEPWEAGRREGNRGTVEGNSFEEKEREKQEPVILLARVSLQSFDGLHKVDDRDVLAELAGLNHKTLQCSSEVSCNKGASERCLPSQLPSTSRL